MYPYHNRIKQRIRAGELINYRFEKNYPRIGECMVLEFCTWPQRRTVRVERLAGYVKVMDEWHEKVAAERGGLPLISRRATASPRRGEA